ncbi:class I SAM-dependent methyltransferase [Kordiimonas aestuarii]|uniref:class I SAM-dependent methyltransferase n=1 Tax=Kordiimonas aestuarii TaxID=1005925 RepID=UPI0021CE748B|nr:class I SAM-dependent methyltransferase [Kordiimonas aestuarii]
MTNQFYDPMAPFYHLVHGDWEASIMRQGAALDGIIRDRLGEGEGRSLLDVTCGIGTQALGLSALGYRVTASDLSPASVERAEAEARERRLDIDFHVADMCKVHESYDAAFDVVYSADNAVTHLLSDTSILSALKAFYHATKPGGLCLVTMRDYDAVEKGGSQLHPFGVRSHKGVNWAVYQVWDWRDDGSDIYDFAMYFTADDGADELKTHVMRAAFYALSPRRMMGLFEQAGFTQVMRTDGVFFQPVITGVRPV